MPPGSPQPPSNLHPGIKYSRRKWGGIDETRTVYTVISFLHKPLQSTSTSTLNCPLSHAHFDDYSTSTPLPRYFHHTLTACRHIVLLFPYDSVTLVSWNGFAFLFAAWDKDEEAEKFFPPVFPRLFPLPEPEKAQPLCEDRPAAVLGQSHQALTGALRCFHPRWDLALTQCWALSLTAALGNLATNTPPHKGTDSVSCPCCQ